MLSVTNNDNISSGVIAAVIAKGVKLCSVILAEVFSWQKMSTGIWCAEGTYQEIHVLRSFTVSVFAII